MVLKILKELEDYRRQISSGYMVAGTPDHTIRFCQAIVAEQGGYNDRASWLSELKMEEFTLPETENGAVLSVNIEHISAITEKALAVMINPAEQLQNFVGFSYLTGGKSDYDASADQEIFPLVVIVNCICEAYLMALKIPVDSRSVAITEIVKAMIFVARVMPNTLPHIYQVMCADEGEQDISSN